MAALVQIGMPDSATLRIVGAATPDPLGTLLTGVARELELGQVASRAWAPLSAGPDTGALADAMVRASASGAPVASQLRRLASDARRDYYSLAQAATRSAGVRVVLPLGLCYLPSFFLLAVVPIVASLVTDLNW